MLGPARHQDDRSTGYTAAQNSHQTLQLSKLLIDISPSLQLTFSLKNKYKFQRPIHIITLVTQWVVRFVTAESGKSLCNTAPQRSNLTLHGFHRSRAKLNFREVLHGKGTVYHTANPIFVESKCHSCGYNSSEPYTAAYPCAT